MSGTGSQEAAVDLVASDGNHVVGLGGSLSRSRWMVSITREMPMYIVLLARRILNSHWTKTVTATTPIWPSIEVHLYLQRASLSLSLPLCLSFIHEEGCSFRLCLVVSLRTWCPGVRERTHDRLVHISPCTCNAQGSLP